MLCGRTIDEMKSFYKLNGSGREYVSNNPSATTAWIEQLQDNLNVPGDAQPLLLARNMCNFDPSRRPAAKEIVLQILQFESPWPYYGFCCSNLPFHGGSPTFSDGIEHPQEETLTVGSLTLEEDIEAPPPYTPAPAYMPPSVGDAELTLQALYAEAPRLESHVLEEITELPHMRSAQQLQDNGHDSFPKVAEQDKSHSDDRRLSTERITNVPNSKPVRVSDNKVYLSDMQRHISSLNQAALPCPWPKCKPPRGLALLLFDSPKSLKEHLRSEHLVHDFSWTRLLEHPDNVHNPSPPILDPKQAGLIHIANKVDGILKTPSSKDAESAKAIGLEDLQGHVRPEASANHRNLPSPIPMPEQTIFVDLPSQPDNGHKTPNDPCDAELPVSTLAPSYIFASRNRFTKMELSTLLPRSRFNGALNQAPLFICGTLMFPSILRARAEDFINPQGVYSSKSQRRLRTDSSDWAKVNFSLQHAAEQMTPARLKGHERRKFSDLSLAMLHPSFKRDAAVNGFLLFGLSDEALLCLDSLYDNQGPRYLFTDSSEDRAAQRDSGSDSDTHSEDEEADEVLKDTWNRQVLERRKVRVEVGLSKGGTSEIEAFAYVTPFGQNDVRSWNTWNIDEFLRSKSFNKLSGNLLNSMWIDAERQLAERMGMKLAHVGDELVSMIQQKNYAGVEQLLKSGLDANSPCSTYGHPLQAAAHFGGDDIVRLLINYGANVKARGGEYGNALIAATVEGNEIIVKLLIKNGADLFALGGKYVSALYQAVDFDDIEMAHILLENGAWLTQDYGELLDLARERGTLGMLRELEMYDAAEIRRQSSITSGNKGRGKSKAVASEKSRRDLMMANSSKIIAACLVQALSLKGTVGKWTGIKGVELMKTAIRNGADPHILEGIRPFIGTFPRIQDFFSDFVVRQFGVNMKPIKHTDKDDTVSDPQPIKLQKTRSLMDSLRGYSSRRVAHKHGIDIDLFPSETRHHQPSPLFGNTAGTSHSSTSLKPMPRAPNRRGQGSISADVDSVMKNSRGSGEDDDVTCMSCDGRGGRRGTERQCAECRGSGELWRASKGVLKTCKACRGRGHRYSERDRCRACSGSGGL